MNAQATTAHKEHLVRVSHSRFHAAWRRLVPYLVVVEPQDFEVYEWLKMRNLLDLALGQVQFRAFGHVFVVLDWQFRMRIRQPHRWRRSYGTLAAD